MPALAPRAVRSSSLSTRTCIVGRLPTVAGCPGSARRATVWPRSLMPSLNISGTCDPCGPRRRVSTIRQISTFRNRTGIVSGRRDSISATGKPSIASRRQPGRTPAAAAPPSGSTRTTSSSAPMSRTSKPGSPLRSTGAAVPLSPPDGMMAKCDSPRRPSMSRMTSRSSPSVCARAARGPSSALTAGQSRPFIVGSKCESRMMVQAASNVSLPRDACAAGTAAAAATSATAPSQVRARGVTSRSIT